MKDVSFLSEAQFEADRAELVYSDPLRFSAEVDESLENIASGRVVAPRFGRLPVRIGILPRLPYSIVYDDRGSGITVIAFAHHKQRPGYWRKRIRK